MDRGQDLVMQFAQFDYHMGLWLGAGQGQGIHIEATVQRFQRQKVLPALPSMGAVDVEHNAVEPTGKGIHLA
jgi:hypothetical protein